MSGADDILKERLRVLDHEPYDAAHDDQHTDGQLAVVAAELAVAHTEIQVRLDTPFGGVISDMWGLRSRHHDTRRRLVIAGALIAAEIDRLDRIR
jgi:hypothetical protein